MYDAFLLKLLPLATEHWNSQRIQALSAARLYLGGSGSQQRQQPLMVARRKTSAHRMNICVCLQSQRPTWDSKEAKNEKKGGVGSCGVLWEEGVGIKKWERKTKPCKVWDEWRRHQEAAKLLPPSGCSAGSGRCPRPGSVGVVEGRDISVALTYPPSPPVWLAPAPCGGSRPGVAQPPVLPRWVQPREGRGASLGPRYALVAKYTKLLGYSSPMVKILPTDTSAVWSVFRFVQENQLQQITQKAIPHSGFFTSTFHLWRSKCFANMNSFKLHNKPREAKIMITIPVLQMEKL